MPRDPRRPTDPTRPLVSVLLPVRDAGDTLESCLASLRRQTLADWECELVDDGSTDATAELAARAARADPRIHLHTTPARGLVAALGTGLDAGRGEYVARMDGDDVMHRERLAVQAALLEREAALTAVGCHVRLFPRRELTDGRRAYERWLNAIVSPASVRSEAFIECPIAHPSLMIRTEALRRFGYRDRGWPEDYDLVLRLLAERHELAVVPRRLLLWRDLPSRLSRTSTAYGLDRFTACKASFLARGHLARDPQYVLCGYGATGKALFRALEALGKRPSHIVELHPGRLGKTIHGALVVPPPALADLPRRPIVVSIAHAVPRREARGTLRAMGFVEGYDFVCAA